MVSQLDRLRDADRSLFPSDFTIRALRDSRYHNSAYAIAELIDNAIEAGAPLIELICRVGSHQLVNVRSRPRVSEIAVLDNGEGMDIATLLDALKFGGGTRHDSISGIGKYGMGLPTSSMSQCKQVDVWTWQHYLDSAWHSSIDARAIAQGAHLVPFPDQDTPIPAMWSAIGDKDIFESPSGTLVIWSELDKIQWKTAQAIIANTSREVGRIHRHYLHEGIHTIRAKSFLENRPAVAELNEELIPNDPLYLMAPTSVPEMPWDNKPMFTQWGDTKYYRHMVGGREQTIQVNYSIVKPEALETAIVTQNPGRTPRGLHARHNIGVSVVREDREIVLEDAFLREGGSAENPQNRWWGCEVLFFRGCDDLFGVDHNKQMVANFTQAAKTLARDDRPTQRILDELGIDDDVIYTIVSDIRDQTRAMMSQIRQMFAQKRRPTKRPSGPSTPEHQAARTQTDADRNAIATGLEQRTRTDRDREQISSEERLAGLAEQFVAAGHTDQSAPRTGKDAGSRRPVVSIQSCPT